MIRDLVMRDISTEGPAVGQARYVVSSTFVVPQNVSSISVVAIGKGGAGSDVTIADSYTLGGITYGGGGGGGGLAYVNNIPVTPGETLTVSVTASESALLRGSTILCKATAGTSASGSVQGVGGTAVVGVGYSGSAGKRETSNSFGGAAAGYSANAPTLVASDGIGGSGATGYGGGQETWVPGIAQNITYYGGDGGGGVGVFGAGANGVAPSGGGSGGTDGSIASNGSGSAGDGGSYGGGGGSGGYSADYDASGKFIRYTGPTGACGPGGLGYLRIVFPGTTRQFPSTNVGNY